MAHSTSTGTSRRLALHALGSMCALAGALAAAHGCSRGSDAASTNASAPPARAAFVDDALCAACHAEEAARWKGSHHDLAMQPATPETVLGDFGGAELVHQGRTTRFRRDGERFLVEAEGAGGKMAEHEVRYCFGVEPLQQYLLAAEGGRLQALSVAWDAAAGRWFHLYPDEDYAPGDPLHWTGVYQTWNAMCAECHSTNLAKGYDATARAYETTFDAIDVGCQECHGPGAEHVAWAGRVAAGERSEPSDASAAQMGLAVDFKGGGAAGQVDQCARCHARRHRVAPRHEAGRAFLDEYMPELLREGLYHADGQILDEVYEYGSFVQSRMHQRGVRCSDCHDPHGLDTRVAGDAVCLQCHGEQAPLERFPTLKAKRYDALEHHHHAPDTEGARCVACHMPERTYMVVDPRHDHSFRVPRPDLTAKVGTPNACNGCHADRSAEWAADAIAGWFPASERRPHYAEALAAGRRADKDALPRLAALLLDQEQPAIARASALELLSGFGPVAAAGLAAGARDAEPLVRVAAAAGLDALPAEARLELGLPLLADPVRAVRVEAARALAAVPAASFTPEQRTVFDAALAEYVAAQEADLDMPAAHLNLGALRAAQGRLDQAEPAYRAALELDPFFLPARFNLANLLSTSGRNPEAETVLRGGIERFPDEGELHYSLGLLLAEMERLDEAAVELERAAALLPGRARPRYNLGLALQALGREAQAEAALRDAHRIDPADPDAVYALANLYARRGAWEQALVYADLLVKLVPDAGGPRELLRKVQSELERRSR